ncbi:hypothetical protein FDP41_012329 [Naegleria fowleri]|uniref:Large ribosomal subunit protein eL24-related N-terminal domain-containing protein n=1 Tax=Naegleria fowleri TaxID=5763 RepID=A0A6A5C4H3_NAEFO|nr:uncharacterized protein FDP41_012329 [Naegleria fowleri]KAF0981672.1 hypothetical protein FDP41_012329 [Naegleria fowleri]CAG4715132.1 unnamed protein product [Naegleria fowleri]
MVIKTDVCLFSGYKIYPGHGVRYVPCTNVQSTRPVFTFVSKKSLHLFLIRRNPREIRWTQLYRRQHKKGSVEQLKKNKKRRVARVERGIAGASIEFIKAQKNQTQQQREKIRASTKEAQKKQNKTEQAGRKEQQKAQKQMMKAQMRSKNVKAPTATSK